MKPAEFGRLAAMAVKLAVTARMNNMHHTADVMVNDIQALFTQAVLDEHNRQLSSKPKTLSVVIKQYGRESVFPYPNEYEIELSKTDKLDAVKQYRNRTNTTLIDTKHVIEAMMYHQGIQNYDFTRSNWKYEIR